ncbi:MAG: histidine kinase dimerization/phosphoacceptor domain -containing protein [Alkalispirochaeta sp.]
MTDRGPLKIAGVYLLFGFIWILISDTLVMMVSTSTDQFARLQTAKGWVYVLLTTALVYILMVIYSRRKELARQEAIDAGAVLARALEQKQLLVRELHHRVKNNLQTVLALLNLSENSDEPEVVYQRVHAMADTHELAMAFPDPTAIEVGDFVQRIVSVVAPHGAYPVTTAVQTEILKPDDPREAPTTITVNQAVPLGMYLHEVLRGMSREQRTPPSGTLKVTVTVTDTTWSVTTSPAAHRHHHTPKTARALCEAWAAQVGGRMVHTDASLRLDVPRQPALNLRLYTVQE